MTQTTDRPTGEVHEVDLAISGMTCASCSARIERKLGKLDGVEAVVNLATEKATVRYSGAVTVQDEDTCPSSCPRSGRPDVDFSDTCPRCQRANPTCDAERGPVPVGPVASVHQSDTRPSRRISPISASMTSTPRIGFRLMAAG